MSNSSFSSDVIDTILSSSSEEDGFTDKGLAAFVRMRPHIVERSLVGAKKIALDVPTLGTIGIGRAPKIRTMRDAIVALPGADPRCVDEIEDCARALMHVHSAYLLVRRPSRVLPELGGRALVLRTKLHDDVQSLIARARLSSSVLESYSSVTGYKNVATDLRMLGNILRSTWTQIQAHTFATVEEVNEAFRLSEELVDQVGARDESPAVIAEVTELRRRAYNLLLDRYEEARRCLTFLRWYDQDVDSFAPSLYLARGRQRGRSVRRAPEAAPSIQEGVAKVALG